LKKRTTILLLIAILSIFILEAIALIKGIDGYALGLAFSGIGGIAGYLVKSYTCRKGEK